MNATGASGGDKNGCDSGAAGSTGIDVDRIDRTDVHTEHTIDALSFIGRVGFDLAFGVIRGIDPLEDVDWTVLETGSVGDTDVEVDGDVRAVDAQPLGFLDRPPDVVAVVLVDDLTVVLELCIDCHR